MKLHVTLRWDTTAKDIREKGNIPAVVYSKHLESPLHIACKKNDFIKRFKESGYSTPLTLEGDKIDQLVLIQDVQVDPVNDVVLHVDFLAVKQDEKVTAEVPVKLTGESQVEKLGEGKIQLLKDFVEVEAFPQDLPHDITLDISVIEKMWDTILVKDIQISDKVEILDDLEQPLVTVLKLAEEEVEEAPAEWAAVEGAEGEAKEGEKKEEWEEKEGEKWEEKKEE